MNLNDAAKQYLVYLKASRLPADEILNTRAVLQNVLWFYGKNKPLDAFDESTTLQYIKINDPFDCNPLHEERGAVFCDFTQWLMANRMIPAWSRMGGQPGCRMQDAGASEALDNWTIV